MQVQIQPTQAQTRLVLGHPHHPHAPLPQRVQPHSRSQSQVQTLHQTQSYTQTHNQNRPPTQQPQQHAYSGIHVQPRGPPRSSGAQSHPQSSNTNAIPAHLQPPTANATSSGGSRSALGQTQPQSALPHSSQTQAQQITNHQKAQEITRAEQRRLKLREIESELAREEAEAIKMTEEQRQTLLRSFTSVKVEFSDLDGKRWTQAALSMFQTQHRKRPHPSSHSHSLSLSASHSYPISYSQTLPATHSPSAPPSRSYSHSISTPSISTPHPRSRTLTRKPPPLVTSAIMNHGGQDQQHYKQQQQYWDQHQASHHNQVRDQAGLQQLPVEHRVQQQSEVKRDGDGDGKPHVNNVADKAIEPVSKGKEIKVVVGENESMAVESEEVMMEDMTTPTPASGFTMPAEGVSTIAPSMPASTIAESLMGTSSGSSAQQVGDGRVEISGAMSSSTALIRSSESDAADATQTPSSEPSMSAPATSEPSLPELSTTSSSEPSTTEPSTIDTEPSTTEPDTPSPPPTPTHTKRNKLTDESKERLSAWLAHSGGSRSNVGSDWNWGANDRDAVARDVKWYACDYRPSTSSYDYVSQYAAEMGYIMVGGIPMRDLVNSRASLLGPRDYGTRDRYGLDSLELTSTLLSGATSYSSGLGSGKSHRKEKERERGGERDGKRREKCGDKERERVDKGKGKERERERERDENMPVDADAMLEYTKKVQRRADVAAAAAGDRSSSILSSSGFSGSSAYHDAISASSRHGSGSGSKSKSRSRHSMDGGYHCGSASSTAHGSAVRSVSSPFSTVASSSQHSRRKTWDEGSDAGSACSDRTVRAGDASAPVPTIAPKPPQSLAHIPAMVLYDMTNPDDGHAMTSATLSWLCKHRMTDQAAVDGIQDLKMGLRTGGMGGLRAGEVNARGAGGDARFTYGLKSTEEREAVFLVLEEGKIVRDQVARGEQDEREQNSERQRRKVEVVERMREEDGWKRRSLDGAVPTAAQGSVSVPVTANANLKVDRVGEVKIKRGLERSYSMSNVWEGPRPSSSSSASTSLQSGRATTTPTTFQSPSQGQYGIQTAAPTHVPASPSIKPTISTSAPLLSISSLDALSNASSSTTPAVLDQTQDEHIECDVVDLDLEYVDDDLTPVPSPVNERFEESVGLGFGDVGGLIDFGGVEYGEEDATGAGDGDLATVGSHGGAGIYSSATSGFQGVMDVDVDVDVGAHEKEFLRVDVRKNGFGEGVGDGFSFREGREW